MINWSIVLAVIVGILIVSALPYLIYASLYIVVALLVSLTFVYIKFREIVLGQERLTVCQVDEDDCWSEWVDSGQIEYGVVDEIESESWREPKTIMVSGESETAGGSNE